MPKLNFSKWYSWENRSQFPLKNSPGVYILTINSENLEGKTTKISQIKYVGKTVSLGGLIGRWRQFDRAVKLGGENHSAGGNIGKVMGSFDKWGKNLFVAACAIDSDMKKTSHKNLIIKAQVSFLEYEAIAKVFKKTGEVPEFNFSEPG